LPKEGGREKERGWRPSPQATPLLGITKIFFTITSPFRKACLRVAASAKAGETERDFINLTSFVFPPSVDGEGVRGRGKIPNGKKKKEGLLPLLYAPYLTI